MRPSLNAVVRPVSMLGNLFLLFVGASLLPGCRSPTDAPAETLVRPQTVVLFATPKILSDFVNPDAGVAAFLDHFEPLTSRARETIVIFGVGNSEHILRYGGLDYWDDAVEWARYIDDWVPVSEQHLDYHLVAGIVSAFKRRAAAVGLDLKVYDQIDKTGEMAHVHWRYSRHPECQDFEWNAYDIRGRLTRDDWVYASAPDGIEEGTQCGKFLVDQTAHYLNDLGFDGILYGNQLGTRGGWLPDNGPGYSAAEAAAILEFLEYSDQMYGEKELMWFDSYNNIDIEREVYSFPAEGYRYFDYLMASGFCVITFTGRYVDNLESKLTLSDQTRVLATLDWVDPWYLYNSMVDFPEESARLEDIAVAYRDRIDGLVFFATDEYGVPVPRPIIEAFAERFFGN